jgi:triosephosphate isomerase
MRRPILAGNWKMHKTLGEARDLIKGLKAELATFDHSDVDVVVCPTFTALTTVRETIRGAPIGLGAQNMYWEQEGAFTGEISPLMITELCEYVILGHSERRELFGETDETVNRKVHAALEQGLFSIVCVGEDFVLNKAGETVPFVGKQIRAALKDVSPEHLKRLIVAYEPIWAIGTGVAATGDEANRIIKEAIRDVLAELFGSELAQTVRIQYGGSVKPSNIEEFMRQSEIDGALVGGASLDAASFAGIVKGLIKAKGLSS